MINTMISKKNSRPFFDRKYVHRPIEAKRGETPQGRRQKGETHHNTAYDQSVTMRRRKAREDFFRRIEEYEYQERVQIQNMKRPGYVVIRNEEGQLVSVPEEEEEEEKSQKEMEEIVNESDEQDKMEIDSSSSESHVHALVPDAVTAKEAESSPSTTIIDHQSIWNPRHDGHHRVIHVIPHDEH